MRSRLETTTIAYPNKRSTVENEGKNKENMIRNCIQDEATLTALQRGR